MRVKSTMWMPLHQGGRGCKHALLIHLLLYPLNTPSHVLFNVPSLHFLSIRFVQTFFLSPSFSSSHLLSSHPLSSSHLFSSHPSISFHQICADVFPLVPSCGRTNPSHLFREKQVVDIPLISIPSTHPLISNPSTHPLPLFS